MSSSNKESPDGQSPAEPSAVDPGEQKPGDRNPGDEPDPPPRIYGSPGLRVAIYFLAVFMVMSITSYVLFGLLEGPEAMQELAESGAADDIDPLLLLWLRAASLPAVWIATVFFLRFFDRRAPAEIGLAWPRGGGMQTLLGMLLAALPLGAWFLLAEPWVDSSLVPFTAETAADEPHMPLGGAGVAGMAVAFLAVALLDELMFRGYIYSSFRERFQWVHAGGMSTLLFVALSAGHPEIGAAGLINVFLLGLCASAMREKTGSIWMAAIFAGSWNLLLGTGLSLPIAGTLFPRLFEHGLEGSAALTGGAFGPEGSWLLGGPILALLVGLAWWTDRDGAEGETRSDETRSDETRSGETRSEEEGQGEA